MSVIPIDSNQGLPYEPFGFTNVVRHGDVLYLSGISGIDQDGNTVGDTIEDQTKQAFRNILLVLQAAGADLEDILQMTSYVVDLKTNGTKFVETRKTILTSPTFTSATIGVESLMMDRLLVEIQCTAKVPATATSE